MAEEKTAQQKLDRLGAMALGFILGLIASGFIIFGIMNAVDIWGE